MKGGADDRLRDNARLFRAIVEHVERLLARGDRASAATWAQVAGEFAWFNHTGAFSSPRLEQLLRDLGASLTPLESRPSSRARTVDVLHVMTQAYQTGGPTQVLACWLEQDDGRRHRIALTRQGTHPVPDKLVAPLGRASDVVRLDARRGGLLERAEALRQLAVEADAVLLHTHPYDVVPLIALSGTDRPPPAVYVNHADHVFWLGTAVSDVVMHMRHSGAALAADRRGVDPSRSVVMARPLRGTDRTLTREHAKRQWGVGPDQVVLVTAADGAKYRPVTAQGFLDLVVPVLQDHPEAVLLAAGPSPVDDWDAAARATGGRVRALGRLPDVSVLHQAADVYVDSFPFSSLTSLLEAGIVGTPAVTFRGHPDSCAVLGTDVPGVDDHLFRPLDGAQFTAQLGALIQDEQLRRTAGAGLEAAIRATHTGAGWQSSVEGLYAAAMRDRPRPVLSPLTDEIDQLDHLVELVMRQTGFAQGVPGCVRDHLGLMRLPTRAAASAVLIAAGLSPSLRDLLPEHVRPGLAAATRRLRALPREQRRRSG